MMKENWAKRAIEGGVGMWGPFYQYWKCNAGLSMVLAFCLSGSVKLLVTFPITARIDLNKRRSPLHGEWLHQPPWWIDAGCPTLRCFSQRHSFLPPSSSSSSSSSYFIYTHKRRHCWQSANNANEKTYNSTQQQHEHKHPAWARDK